jgi:hypothetical protein
MDPAIMKGSWTTTRFRDTKYNGDLFLQKYIAENRSELVLTYNGSYRKGQKENYSVELKPGQKFGVGEKIRFVTKDKDVLELDIKEHTYEIINGEYTMKNSYGIVVDRGGFYTIRSYKLERKPTFINRSTRKLKEGIESCGKCVIL